MPCELSYVGRYDEVLTNEFASEKWFSRKTRKENSEIILKHKQWLR